MPRLPAKKSKKVSKQRAKSSSWKLVKVTSRLKRVAVLFFISLFAVGFSVLLFAVFSFYNFVRFPFASGASDSITETIKDEEIFTIGFSVIDDMSDEASKVNNLAFVIFDQRQNRISVYSIPSTIEMDLPERFGYGTISKTYALGELVENKKGFLLLNKSLEKIFARKADRYVSVDNDFLSKLRETYSLNETSDLVNIFSIYGLLKAPEMIPLLSDHLRTDLTPSEMLFVGDIIRGVSGSQVHEKELRQEDIENYFELDKKTADVFVDPDVLDEKKRILILNGAGVPKLGSYAARFIEKFGGSLVGIDNATRVYDKSVIVADEHNSATLKHIAEQLGIENILVPEVGVQLVDEQTVNADIVVIVGIDYSRGL